MQSIKLRLALGATALAALALPALVAAHPSVYQVVGKLATAPETQTITIDATGGTFKPSAAATSVAWNAPAYAVQAALGADPAIGRNATTGQANVLVLGDPGGPYTLRFQGSLASTDQAQVVPDATGLTGGAGTAVAATLVQGGLADIRYEDDPSGASLPDDVVRSVIANDGYVAAFVETNGLDENGWLNLRLMPSGYRRPASPGVPMTLSEWLNWPMAQTGVQSHATCQNVPQLDTEANVLAVQSNATDPFWNYVPWQKTSAGLGDEPERWLDVVETAVGVDLTTLTTAADFRAACEALNAGSGVYVPADSPSNPANGMIADAVAAATAPLNAMIADLNAEVDDLNDQIDSLTNRPLRVQLQARRSSGRVVVMVTGPLSQAVKVRLQIGKGLADRLGIGRVLDTANLQFGAKGAVLATLKPGNRAAKALSSRGAFDVKVVATSGSLESTASGTLRTYVGR